LGRRPGLIPVPARVLQLALRAAGRAEWHERLARALGADASALAALGWVPRIGTRASLAALARDGVGAAGAAARMIPNKPAPGVSRGWIPVFGRRHAPATGEGRTKMEIRRCGSVPTRRGPADWFTGTVWQDPVIEAPAPARIRGARVSFEPGARTAWHTHP